MSCNISNNIFILYVQYIDIKATVTCRISNSVIDLYLEDSWTRNSDLPTLGSVQL